MNRFNYITIFHAERFRCRGPGSDPHANRLIMLIAHCITPTNARTANHMRHIRIQAHALRVIESVARSSTMWIVFVLKWNRWNCSDKFGNNSNIVHIFSGLLATTPAPDTSQLALSLVLHIFLSLCSLFRFDSARARASPSNGGHFALFKIQNGFGKNQTK